MFVDFNILNQLGSPSINSNTFANRPSAGQVGRLFVSTDTFEIYRDTGTGWDLIGGPGSSTVTGSGTANTFTIFTGTNSIGDSSYLTQGTNAINVANAEINLPSNNVISGTNYGIKQIMATNDYWRIYGNTISSDVSEMVLELGDNAEPISINGQRYRFFHNNTWSGTAKDVLIVDYENSTFNTNIIVNSPNSIGVRTATPGAALDVHSTADVGFQLNGTGATPSILQAFLSAGVSQYEIGYNWNSDINYRRFSIYDVQGAKEVISIDQQSRFVGINYQYSSLSDQPAYTLDVSGSGRFTDSGYFATASGNLLVGSTSLVGSSIFQVTGNAYVSGKLGVNVSSPTAKIDLAGQSELLRLINNDAYISFRNSTDATRYAYIQAQATALTISSDVGFIDFYATTGAMRFQTTGNLCIGTTTDAGQKLQVNGTALINNTAIIGGTTVLGIDVNGVGSIGNPAILATVTSGDGNAIVYRRTFSANTASVALLGQLYNSNNSFNTYSAIYSAIVDNTAGSEYGRLFINCDKNGTETTELTIDSSGLKTSTPVGGTAAYWKFGQRVAAAVVLDATQYIELEVGGTLYKLAIVT